ncbi:MAG: hypothetical protein M1544_00410 [Candidatus Marsarchaeota archaeon]|nr:hypothetical protein [Candidatus Marsarchaeota archaeon]MCL5101807.1 hypothetical protein [Candidatus Marsarchaeota archaeon]
MGRFKTPRDSRAIGTNLLLFAITTVMFALMLEIRWTFLYGPGPSGYVIGVFWILYSIYFLAFAFRYADRGFARIGAAVCAISAISFIAALISVFRFNSGIIMFNSLYPLMVEYAIAIPVLMATLFGFYFLKNNFRHARAVAVALFITAIALFFFYQLYIFGYSGIGSDDEMVIAYFSLHYALAGHNPYDFSSAKILFSNGTRYGFTLLTNNTVVGRLDYPALFMFLGAPFYSMFAGTAASVMDHGNSIGYLALLLVSLFLFASFAGKRILGDFRILAPAIVVFMLYSLQIVSFQYPFMVIMLLLMLRFAKSRYLFLILGIAASVQELLWVPVLLAIVYVFSTKGIRDGLKLVAMGAIVFLAINGYFIALGPGTFIAQVFKPLNGNLVPFYFSPGSFLIQEFYPIPLSAYSVFFYLLVAASALITAYSGNRLTILTGMFISYMAIDHSLIVYFLMPVAVMASAIAMGTRFDEKSILKAFLKSHGFESLKFLASTLSALSIIAILALVYFHAQYESNFGLRVISQSMHHYGNSTLYNVSLYDPVGNMGAYVLEYYYTYNSESNVAGLNLTNESYNSYITNSTCKSGCNVSGYTNNNLIRLEKGTDSLHFYVPANASSVECAFYSDRYFYLCPSIYT